MAIARDTLKRELEYLRNRLNAPIVWITGPVTIVMGLRGIGVAQAGVAMDKTGHHHILVNVAELPPMDAPLPAADQGRMIRDGPGGIRRKLSQVPAADPWRPPRFPAPQALP